MKFKVIILPDGQKVAGMVEGAFYSEDLKQIDVYIKTSRHGSTDRISIPVIDGKEWEMVQLVYEMLNDDIAAVDLNGLYEAVEEL